jgi:hypothetical protein
LCPTDRLAQRAGRLSRFKTRFDKQQNVVGELYLIEPEKTTKDGVKTLYPAPYGHYRQGSGWVMSAVLEEANKQLAAGDYSAQKFVELVNALYPKVADETAEVRNNRVTLEDAAIANWLLLPQAETDLNDDDTHMWRSRDISPQKVVYANMAFSALDMEGDRTDFPSWFAFQEWALPRAISIAVYDFKQAQESLKLTEVTLLINEEREKIWVINPSYYDAQQGLRFDKAPSAEDE